MLSVQFVTKVLHVIETPHIPQIDLYNQYVPSFVSGDHEAMQCVEDSIHLIMKPHDINADINNSISLDSVNYHLTI